MVQWLRLHAPNAGGTGFIPGWGTEFPHAAKRAPPKKRRVHGGLIYLPSNSFKFQKRILETVREGNRSGECVYCLETIGEKVGMLTA